ncbi:MAG: A/G-specific adenine glycosylase [Chloroflexi bacterium]|nr:A/G-specific adenine glycosylase [Chloroflexota bacterium]
MSAFSTRLLKWYAKHKRDLPWRKTRDPYRIWLSEILLQQTRVEAVIPYYKKFLARFPDVFALANAPLDAVLKTWEGAGYYARARNLHRAAKVVVEKCGGKFPKELREIRELPGVGRYTAGAIASIAFNVDTPVVDGNVTRVLCRYFGIRDDPKASATQDRLWEIATDLLPKGHAYEFNQALMELGATICAPKNPRCLLCPVQQKCFARQDGLQNVLPVKRAKQELLHRIIAAGVIYRRGRILIQQRLNQGLLGGLWEFPGGKWESGETLEECVAREVREELGIDVRVGEKIISVEHAFSHFSITLHAFHCEYISGRVRISSAQKFKWVAQHELEQYAFPAANKKIIVALLPQVADARAKRNIPRLARAHSQRRSGTIAR